MARFRWFQVLNYRRSDSAAQDALLADFLPHSETVVMHATAMRLPELPDPGDRMFLFLARQAGAQVLVSGDFDIQLVRCPPEPTRTMTAAEFRQWLDGAWTFP